MTGSEMTGSEPETETGKKKGRMWQASPTRQVLGSLVIQESMFPAGLAKVPLHGPCCSPAWALLLAYSEAELWGYLYPLQQIF